MKILYGSIISPFVRKILMVLHFKNITFKSEELIPFLPAHKKILLNYNPLGKVPVFQDNDFMISDTSVIAAYLDKKYPEHTIYPQTAEHYAECLWLEEYADTQLIPSLAFVFFHTTIAEKLGIKPDLKEVQHTFENKLPVVFNYLDKIIGSEKNYLINNQLSLADFSVSTAFLNFEFAGFEVDAKLWKNLSRYIETISHQQLIAKVFSEARSRWEASVHR